MTGALDPFLDELEAPVPSACGGTAAAAAAAMGAALVVMVARGSSRWADGPGVEARARALRTQLTTLGDDDADAFAEVLSVLRGQEGTPEQRDRALGDALLRAAEVPLRIAEAAAEVAELATRAAVDGAPKLQADASAAAALAEAAMRAAAHLVDVNLATVPGDSRSERAAALAAGAAAARARALAVPR